MRLLNLVELAFDRLAMFEIINVTLNQNRLDDLSEHFQCPVKSMLLGIGI